MTALVPHVDYKVEVTMGYTYSRALPPVWSVTVDGVVQPRTSHRTHHRETTTPLGLADLDQVPDGLEFADGFIVDCACGREYIALVARGEQSEHDALRVAEAKHVNTFGGWAHVFIGSHAPNLAKYADYVIGPDMVDSDAMGPRYFLTPDNLDDVSPMLEYAHGPGLLIAHTLGRHTPEAVMRELESYAKVTGNRSAAYMIRRGDEYRERMDKTDNGYVEHLRNENAR